MRLRLIPLLAIAACTNVDTTEHCIETRYGAIVNEDMGPGIHSTITTEANCFSLVDHNFPASKDEKESIETQTRDPITVSSDLAIVYAYDPANIVKVFKSKRSQAAVEVEIVNAIRSGYRDAVAGWSMSDIFSSRRGELDDSVRVHIQKKIGDRALIKNVFVRDIRVPENIVQARNNAAQQQQMLDKAQKQLAIDSMQARGQIITAEATSRAKQLEASSYAANPKLLDLEIAKAYASGLQNLCPKAANSTCIVGGSVMDSWRKP